MCQHLVILFCILASLSMEPMHELSLSQCWCQPSSLCVFWRGPASICSPEATWWREGPAAVLKFNTVTATHPPSDNGWLSLSGSIDMLFVTQLYSFNSHPKTGSLHLTFGTFNAIDNHWFVKLCKYTIGEYISLHCSPTVHRGLLYSTS